jgi:hypothetical protein
VLPEAVEALHRAVSSTRLVLSVPGVGGALDWSPDGSMFITEGPEESGLVDIRDATTGARIRSFQGHDDDINDVEFSADGSLLGHQRRRRGDPCLGPHDRGGSDGLPAQGRARRRRSLRGLDQSGRVPGGCRVAGPRPRGRRRRRESRREDPSRASVQHDVQPRRSKGGLHGVRRCRHRGRQLSRFRRYYNDVRPHRALARRTPWQAYTARPKATATGPTSTPVLVHVTRRPLDKAHGRRSTVARGLRGCIDPAPG